MNYLSYDAHVALNMNCTSEKDLLRLEEMWSEDAKAYRNVFETLVNRLPKPVFDRFSSWGFTITSLSKWKFFIQAYCILKLPSPCLEAMSGF